MEKNNNINKMQSRLNEQLKSFDVKEAVLNYAKTQRNIKKKQYLNTLKMQIGVLNSFTDFKKKQTESPQIKVTKLLQKVFADEDMKSKLSEDKNMLLTYFLNKYPVKSEVSAKKESSKTRNSSLLPTLDLKCITQTSNEKSKHYKSPVRKMKLNSTRVYESERITEKKTKIFGEDNKKANIKHVKRGSDIGKKQNLNRSVVEKPSNIKKQK
jgi:hypothetical protein